ncbi:MAG: class I SAM-dependent methyltransferase [Candidatus Limnocylindrales bacterium]
MRRDPPRGIFSPLPVAEPTLDERWAESRRPLVERLHGEIVRTGPITFARFMEVALYDPRDGYYRARPGQPPPPLRSGRSGDFLTAPELDPLFGAALARQLEECWERLGRPTPFTVRDEGAGSGALGLALLEELRRRDAALLEALAYLPLEADGLREAAARAHLELAGLARWLAPPGACDRAIEGVVVANEFLDALPVHRLIREAGAWRELFVTWRDGWFAELVGPPTDERLAASLEASGVHLADGQRAEVSLAAQAWIRALPDRLARGYALIVDYGGPAEALYGAPHPDGLLRTYRAHHAGDDPFRAVGEQDITAHVDTSALERAAAAAGLERLGRTTLAEALAGLEAGELLVELGRRTATSAARYRNARNALMRLLDPAGMGRFQVLVLGRAVAPGPPLRALTYHLPPR